MPPHISVCVPVFNASRYLEEALDSVLAQSFDDFELIAIDDRSSDGTLGILERYAAGDGRMRISVNEQNIGMAANWNRCLAAAQGEYIKYVFADDRLASPHTLRRMVDVMDTRPTVSLVASARRVIDRDSRILRIVGKYGSRNIVLSGREVIRDCMIAQRNLVGEPSVVLFRRAHAGTGFNGRYQQLVDLEMWLRLLEGGDFAYLHEPLCDFRVHEAQATAGNVAGSLHIDEQVMLLRDRAGKADGTFSRLELAYMRFVPCVRYWEQYERHGRMSAEESWERIGRLFHGSKSLFRVLLPLYKLFTSYLSIARRFRYRFKRRALA